ncbi:hypothetical protein AQI88_30085 [Streptomyces cellostaticus]|uniref:Uncharacterized protein n=1 Tax=Streptomyces cellostaticus TaxID=67285 RepID=A0A101NH00_9ACTN|nr:hypothetical protein [Streptomyces cellostaticus]KUM92807.1 hypothetical protein AQI88_30085 [Streptomyces cellostaticus]GHI06769.1 membrane protein [Streptomyces cellostaticus]
MKHSTNPQTRRGHRGGPARRIGRTLALVLPVVLVLSGTLAVTRVNWTGSPSGSVLTASDVSSAEVSSKAVPQAPQDVLREQLMSELQHRNPGVVLTHLQEAVNGRPSLARHCASIAHALGKAAERIYGASRAQSYARPVCDTSFASGVLAAHS